MTNGKLLPATDSIEKRLDLIIELLFLVVQQVHKKDSYDRFVIHEPPNSHGVEVEWDNRDANPFDKVVSPYRETLSKIAAAIEALEKDLPKPQEPQ